MLWSFLADGDTGGLALQYGTAILHMHHLFIKYRKMDCFPQDITEWSVKMNTEYNLKG